MPLPMAVPPFVVDSFRIPPFLLPIYQAAGMQYGVRWEVLAAINEIETDYGRNLAISPAGALGWMQFMPATWMTYGVDANHDGVRDPFNPVDAIFAAARYLHAAGADRELRGALLAYNHAGWYADSVLARAQAIGGMPTDLLDGLTTLAEGRFPVRGHASYAAGRLSTRRHAPVVAVNDGRVLRLGWSRRRGRFLVLRDAAGNTFSYSHLGGVFRLYGHRVLRRGSRLAAGTAFGRSSGSLGFAVRPAGAPRIDPRPILAGWRLAAATGAYRVEGAAAGSIGRIMLMSRADLARRVLASPAIHIYACGRQDIAAGRIDRRVLAAMLYLASSGLRPTISSLRCGHRLLTSSGNVSEHVTGTAMDISAVNGVVISPATQGPGSITEVTIRRLLTLQGAMKPHQIISLMTFAGADNTLAMGDHANHIHVGWRPAGAPDSRDATLGPAQWTELIGRLGRVANPALRTAPTRLSLRLTRRPAE
jgi:Transglycosylase SLT domain